MKKRITTCLLLSLLSLASMSSYCQKGQNEFEKRRVEATLTPAESITLSAELKKDDNDIKNALLQIFQNSSTRLSLAKGSRTSIDAISTDIHQTITNIDNFGVNRAGGENAAVIVIYRDMKIEASSGSIDFASLNNLIIHKKRGNNELSNYLLETKKIFFVFIDLEDAFYEETGQEEDKDKKLSNTSIKIEYKTNAFKKSLQDLRPIFGSMGGRNKSSGTGIKLTLIEIEPKRIKVPCNIIGSHKQIKEDLMTFPIHERNIATAQVGVENTNYTANNFSISGNNLVVKPDTTQTTNWKSSLYALIELHLPRDIDNFNPLWKDLFSIGRERKIGTYLYDALLSRIGVYGGVKIGKDPLSNLYAGFNFAITKELSINLGWTWTNEVTPQVTEIGNIGSVSDALKYAKRKYTGGKFSWGLSFSPSSVAQMLGIGKGEEK